MRRTTARAARALSHTGTPSVCARPTPHWLPHLLCPSLPPSPPRPPSLSFSPLSFSLSLFFFIRYLLPLLLFPFFPSSFFLFSFLPPLSCSLLCLLNSLSLFSFSFATFSLCYHFLSSLFPFIILSPFLSSIPLLLFTMSSFHPHLSPLTSPSSFIPFLPTPLAMSLCFTYLSSLYHCSFFNRTLPSLLLRSL